MFEVFEKKICLLLLVCFALSRAQNILFAFMSNKRGEHFFVEVYH